jgi:hypothetical protein
VLPWGTTKRHVTTDRSSTQTEALRNEFLVTMDSLGRRRADLIAEDLIAGYVALHWLEWDGGSLKLTVTGSNVCAQLRAAKSSA